MNLSEEDARLLARAAAWAGPEPTSENISQIAREQGLDFATALLHEKIRRRPASEALLRAALSGRTAPAGEVIIGVVPGAFHREHRHTGADGKRILNMARDLGIAAEVIPVASFGRLGENARIIHEWIAAHHGSRVALISLSKGGADVKHALSLSGGAERFAHVSTWVSLSGVVQGTPLIRWLHERRLRWWAVKAMLWWRGHPRETLDDLRHGPGASLSRWAAIPDHLRVVHVCGFPLQRHLSHPWAHRAHARLAALGPNDGGGNLLADLLDCPGEVCPVWGADHYLSPTWDVMPLLTGIVAAALAPRQEIMSASLPSTAPVSKSSA